MTVQLITKKDGTLYTCDVCAEPATTLARDVMRHEDRRKAFDEYSPVGKLKAGCDKHPVDSVEHVTELPRVE